MASILSLEGVSHQFSGCPSPAVADVSLNLAAGDILALLGPSGCGKTTLLRLIAGFETPQQGRIVIDGTPVCGTHHHVPPERRSVGMVFQDFALFPHLTVAENLAFGLQRLSKATIQERVSEALALIGLQGFQSRYPHELSGGQQQRVALARALAPRPSLVLLDEPLSNLDVQVRVALRQEIRDVLKATGTSAVFVTHDQEEAMAIADQVAVMRTGHMEQHGTPESLYHEPTSRFVAEFVTQANFLKANQKGQVWETELGTFGTALVQCACNVLWTDDHHATRSGELMIRQEDVVPVVDEAGAVVVRDRQFLGREYRYTLETLSGQLLYARTSTRTQIPVGTRVSLNFSNAILRFFPDEVSVVDAVAAPIR
ncbi:ABC transporter ATP-binding protein [Leptolyngbya sp. PL-A3]|nr:MULTISPECIES: ABC transporter ATP-binding protein [unclassified Leptolyngbya]